jgi:hypothetical protein
LGKEDGGLSLGRCLHPFQFRNQLLAVVTPTPVGAVAAGFDAVIKHMGRIAARFVNGENERKAAIVMGECTGSFQNRFSLGAYWASMWTRTNVARHAILQCLPQIFTAEGFWGH